MSSASSSTSSADSTSMSLQSSAIDQELNHLESPTALQHISYYASSLDIERVDGEVIHQTVRLLADTIACALAASATNKEIEQVQQFAVKRQPPSSAPVAPIWGTSLTCAPSYAGMVNSSMIRCLDANDLYIPRPPQSVLSGGHCSDAMGGVLALVDQEVNTGQQILAATIIVRTTWVTRVLSKVLG